MHRFYSSGMIVALYLMMLSAAGGQLQSEFSPPDYEYQSDQFFDDNDALPKDYIPVLTPKEQKFLEGLIVEAGRHILFPKFYATKEDYVAKDEEDVGKMKFYELRGQPEMEQSYMNQKSRRGRMDCPEHCPFYKPVCGSDGKVYESDCHMQKENCGSSSVTIGPWQKCRGKHYLCPSTCLDLNDPVCGSDGRIYHNVCVLRKRNCGKLVDALPVRKCYENIRQAKSLECPTDCQEFYKPVCGSDGVIYYNECFLKKRTCKQGIVEMDMEDCASVPRCPGSCLSLYDPVCGSDGRLYMNECLMLQKNCGKKIKAVARDLCGITKEEDFDEPIKFDFKI